MVLEISVFFPPSQNFSNHSTGRGLGQSGITPRPRAHPCHQSLPPRSHPWPCGERQMRARLSRSDPHPLWLSLTCLCPPHGAQGQGQEERGSMGRAPGSGASRTPSPGIARQASPALTRGQQVALLPPTSPLVQLPPRWGLQCPPRKVPFPHCSLCGCRILRSRLVPNSPVCGPRVTTEQRGPWLVVALTGPCSWLLLKPGFTPRPRCPGVANAPSSCFQKQFGCPTL